jgi:hypothetical protein
MGSVRVAIGRTVNLGGYASLRVDVAHEVDVGADGRSAALAEVTALCRTDLDALIAAERERLHVAADNAARAEAEADALRAAAADLVAMLRKRELSPDEQRLIDSLGVLVDLPF